MAWVLGVLVVVLSCSGAFGQWEPIRLPLVNVVIYGADADWTPGAGVCEGPMNVLITQTNGSVFGYKYTATRSGQIVYRSYNASLGAWVVSVVFSVPTPGGYTMPSDGFMVVRYDDCTTWINWRCRGDTKYGQVTIRNVEVAGRIAGRGWGEVGQLTFVCADTNAVVDGGFSGGGLLTNGWIRVRTSVVTNEGLTQYDADYEVAGVRVRSVRLETNGNARVSYDLESELRAGGVGSASAASVVGSLVTSSLLGQSLTNAVGGVGGGVVVGDVTVTGAFTANIDWTQGVAYARSELPAGTNWGWVHDAARGVATGSEDRPGPPGVPVWSGAPSLVVPIRPGVVLDIGAGIGDWMTRAGAVVRSLLSALVVVGFGWWVGQSVHEDLRTVWTAPQGRTAGQTVLGTGTQAVSALAVASVLIGAVAGFAGLAWSWVLSWLGVFSGLSGLVPGWLSVVLDVGPWATILSCLTLVPGVLAARAWIVSVGSAMVRLLTGL